MWKAMMFSVRPVKTASAALKTRRWTVRYQTETTMTCVALLTFRDSGLAEYKGNPEQNQSQYILLTAAYKTSTKD